MWTVRRRSELGFIGQDVFATAEEAKRGFRKIIANKLGEGISSFTERIDVYCKEFYPAGAPKEFEQLKELLTKLATDPSFPQSVEEIEMEDFEDENVEFYIGPCCELYVYVNNPEVKEKFINAEINAVKFFDENFRDENFFFITDNRDGSEGAHYYINIELSESTEEEVEEGTVNSGLPEEMTKYS